MKPAGIVDLIRREREAGLQTYLDFLECALGARAKEDVRLAPGFRWNAEPAADTSPSSPSENRPC